MVATERSSYTWQALGRRPGADAGHTRGGLVAAIASGVREHAVMHGFGWLMVWALIISVAIVVTVGREEGRESSATRLGQRW